MYENALLPIALTNKLVSLSAHPSTQILTNFAKLLLQNKLMQESAAFGQLFVETRFNKVE